MNRNSRTVRVYRQVAACSRIFSESSAAFRMIFETLRLILRPFREEDVAEPANGGQLLHKSAAISRRGIALGGGKNPDAIRAQNRFQRIPGGGFHDQLRTVANESCCLRNSSARAR